MKFEDFVTSYRNWSGKKGAASNPWKLIGKLAEEVGEASEAFDACHGNLKKISKIYAHGQTPHEALEEELGDVIVTVLRIIDHMGLSYYDVFERTARKLDNRAKIPWQQES